jgi:UDP-N-acetylglucosamine--dolichyl-phosphate N-acetylglucosaminephosphotransferase
MAFLISIVITVVFLPTTIEMLEERNKFAEDVHKKDKQMVPKGGGFVLLFAVVAALLIIVGFSTFIMQNAVNPAILGALVSILMAGMVGLLDDNLDFRDRTKIALPLVASIPLMALNVGTTTMSIPLIGDVNLQWAYPLLVVPLMTTFIVDSTNMYGGMNGLECGLSIVNSSAIVVYALLTPILTGNGLVQNQMDGATIAASLLGASIVFFLFNKYPAKVLPGDVGRLPIGAAMAAALIIGNMDRLAVILYLPFLLNFMMYLVYRLKVKRTGMDYQKFAKPKEDGSLDVVGPYTMYWLLPHFFQNVTERKNVLFLILLQAILAYGGVVLLLVVGI